MKRSIFWQGVGVRGTLALEKIILLIVTSSTRVSRADPERVENGGFAVWLFEGSDWPILYFQIIAAISFADECWELRWEARFEGSDWPMEGCARVRIGR